jgi:hypothetical protein
MEFRCNRTLPAVPFLFRVATNALCTRRELQMVKSEEGLAVAVGKFITHCVYEQGFEYPLFLAAVAVNGSCVFHRFETQGAAGTDMTSHVEGEAFVLPVNMMLTDRRGEAARMVIEHDGVGRIVH